ncbi:hypothetical protein BJ912DRAFT_811483, partial [Pholiota molesta]
PPPREYFANRMILAPRNDDVTELNAQILKKMSGVEKTYYSADKVIREAGADGPSMDTQSDDFEQPPIPVEVLRDMDEGNIPPGELTLKVRLLGGEYDGQIALIPRI